MSEPGYEYNDGTPLEEGDWIEIIDMNRHSDLTKFGFLIGFMKGCPEKYRLVLASIISSDGSGMKSVTVQPSNIRKLTAEETIVVKLTEGYFDGI